MPYTNFTEKLLGLQDLIITNVIKHQNAPLNVQL